MNKHKDKKNRKDNIVGNLVGQIEISIRNSTEFLVLMRRIINKLFW